MGDLNLAPLSHDRTSGNDNDKEQSLFSNLLERTGLIDSFREVNPPESSPPSYSYHRHTSPPASSRIDHILIDPALQGSILRAKILIDKSHTASDTGDHGMVIVHLRRSNISAPQSSSKAQTTTNIWPLRHNGLDSKATRDSSTTHGC